MTFIGGALGVAGGPGGGMRFTQTRGRIQNGALYGVNYPSPFFDLAHTYLPATVKQMFRWCRYYFMTNPLINATVFKLSEYPVTDLIIESDDIAEKSRWSEYMHDHLRFNAFRVEVGLDYFTYGNALVSLGYDFKKYLTCTTCGWKEEASKCRHAWVFTNYTFRLTCPRCEVTGDANVSEIYLKNPSGIKLIRWNPEDVEIVYNDLTGNYTYFYTIPPVIRNDIVIGRKEVIETIPQVFIRALKEQKGIIFSPDKVFHMRRPSLATQDRGWGTPLLLPVLKDTYYLQLMKKAQEAILLEHIVPLRILFPQPASGSADPFTMINLGDWKDHVAMEIARWRFDHNYMPIMPLPIGNQTIGGDGKALLLTSEIQQWSDQILIGMGVPREFLVGGLSYAGTNVSLRMLENSFIGYNLRHKGLARFVIQEVASFLDWPVVKSRFKPFKMADDLQRKAYRFQLNGANKISDTTLLADEDLDQADENKLMIDETSSRMEAMKAQQLAMAEIQGQSQLVMAKYQVKAQQEQQKAMAAPPAPGEPGGQDAALTQGGGTPGGQEASAPSLSQEQQSQMATPQPPAGDQLAQLVSSQLSRRQNMQSSGSMQVDLPTLAMMQAKQISSMDPVSQQLAVQNLRAQSPELADLVMQYLKQLESQAAVAGQQPAVDMRPMPEQRPPRRAAGMG